MNEAMHARDLYFRWDRGPVQCARVWDAELFANAQVDAGATAKPPVVFQLCTEAEYKAQRKARRSPSPRTEL